MCFVYVTFTQMNWVLRNTNIENLPEKYFTRLTSSDCDDISHGRETRGIYTISSHLYRFLFPNNKFSLFTFNSYYTLTLLAHRCCLKSKEVDWMQEKMCNYLHHPTKWAAARQSPGQFWFIAATPVILIIFISFTASHHAHNPCK